jgi:hypothetical protein
MKKKTSFNYWLTQAFGLGPIAYEQQIERQLRREIKFKEFSKLLHEHLDLVGLDRLLPSRIVTWLYDFALRARVEKETVDLAVKWTKEWRNSETKNDKLIDLLKTYPSFDPERILRSAVGSRKGSRTRERVSQLLENLSDLRYQIRLWSKFADSGPWRDSYKWYVIAMDNHLQNRFRDSKKQDRAMLIEAVFDVVGMKQKASAESILRALRRERNKRKKLSKSK